MGCYHGKCSRSGNDKQRTDISKYNASNAMIENLKKEMIIIRACFFQVAEVKPIEMSHISSDIEWAYKNSNNKNIVQIQELSNCFKMNIRQRGFEIYNIVAQQLSQVKSQHLLRSSSSLECQSSEKKDLIDSSIVQLLHYSEILPIEEPSQQENIEDSESAYFQQFNQQNSQELKN